MSLQILVVAYRNGKQLENLARSLKVFLKCPATLWIWDNGEARDDVETLIPNFSDTQLKIRALGDAKNIGFSAAVNRGLENICKEIGEHDFSFLLINPDAELASELTDEIVEKWRAQKGIVGLRVFNDPAKSIRQASARSFPSFLTSIAGREGFLTRLFPRNSVSQKYLGSYLDANRESRVDWVSGCAFFCTHDIWKKIGGYDESYFLYVEDVDLGRKAKLRGIPVFYSPLVDVVHLIRGSSEKRFWKADYYHHLGMWIYFVKWSKSPAFLLGPLVFVGIWLRFIFRRLVGA